MAKTEKHEINELLKECKQLIDKQALKYVPRNSIPHDDVDLEVNDLGQESLINTWQALLKKDNAIRSIGAYTRRTVHNKAQDRARQQKRSAFLETDNDGEPLGHVLILPGESMMDPAEKVELEEMLLHYSTTLETHVPLLPRQQRYAMLCALKEQVLNLLPLERLFQLCGENIEAVNWSKDEKELQSQRSSLSIARRKLRLLKEEFTDY